MVKRLEQKLHKTRYMNGSLAHDKRHNSLVRRERNQYTMRYHVYLLVWIKSESLKSHIKHLEVSCSCGNEKLYHHFEKLTSTYRIKEIQILWTVISFLGIYTICLQNDSMWMFITVLLLCLNYNCLKPEHESSVTEECINKHETLEILPSNKNVTKYWFR